MKAARVVGVASLLFALSQFFRVTGAVVAPDLQRDLALTSEGLGSIGAAFFYAFAIAQIPLAIFLDRAGARRTMTLLSLVGVAGALVFAAAGGRATATLGRALLGIGMAGNLMGTLKLVARWFPPARFATISGLVVGAGSVGSLLATTPLALLVRALGWRLSFVVLAAVTGVVTLLFWTVVRDGPSAGVAHHEATMPLPARIRRLLGDRNFWLISLGAFCRYGTFVAISGLWIMPFLVEVSGLSPITAANLVLLLNVAYILGSPLGGWISDRVLSTRKGVMLLAFAATVTAELALALAGRGTGVAALGAILALLGLGAGFGQVIYAHARQVMPREMEGMAMTGVNFFVMLGGAVFLHGMGWVIDQVSTGAAPRGPEAYRAAFGGAAVAVAVAFIGYLFTDEHASRSRG